MLQDIHGDPINIPVNVTGTGDTVVVAGQAGRSIYILELIGTLAGTGSMVLKAEGGPDMTLFAMEDQAITLTSIPGHDNVPRFKCPAGQDFIINLTGGVFTGNLYYAWRD